MQTVNINRAARTPNEIIAFYLNIDHGRRHADYMCQKRLKTILSYCFRHPSVSEHAQSKVTDYFNEKKMQHENQ